MKKQPSITIDTSRYTASVRDLADLYRVDVSTIRRWVAQGVLRAVRIGKTTLRIDPDSLQAEPILGVAA